MLVMEPLGQVSAAEPQEFGVRGMLVLVGSMVLAGMFIVWFGKAYGNRYMQPERRWP